MGEVPNQKSQYNDTVMSVSEGEWAEELGGEDSGGEGKGIEQLRSYNTHESNT